MDCSFIHFIWTRILLEYRRAKTHSERFIPDIFTAVAIIGMISYVVPFVEVEKGFR